MTLTKEQFDYIAQCDAEFAHALYDNYFRVVNWKVLAEYDKIYQSIFKRNSKILKGCSRCVLQDIKALAKIYFQDKQEMESQNKSEEENIEETPKPKKMSQYTYGEKTKKTKTVKTNKTK